MDYQVYPITKDHESAIHNLLKVKFLSALQVYPMLPDKFTTTAKLHPFVLKVTEQLGGFIVYQDRIPICFMSGFKLDRLFYERKGYYTPEWAHYIDETHIRGTYLLLETLYEELRATGHNQHSISLMNHQDGTILRLYDLGYASRCMDGHRLTSQAHDLKQPLDPAITVRLGTLADIPHISQLLDSFHNYMVGPKVLTGFHYPPANDTVPGWFEDDNTSIMVLCDENIPVGFIRLVIGESGGCDASYDQQTLGIFETFIAPSHQGKGYGALLIEAADIEASNYGMKRLATDWETTNFEGHGFWSKHFTPTIRSMVRTFG